MTFSDQRSIANLTYHHEDGTWWADSPNLLGLFAGGETLDDAKALARQVVADEMGDEALIVEWMPLPGPLARDTSKGQEEATLSVFDGWCLAEAKVAWEWDFPKSHEAPLAA
jgi:hypothetical protein